MLNLISRWPLIKCIEVLSYKAKQLPCYKCLGVPEDALSEASRRCSLVISEWTYMKCNVHKKGPSVHEVHPGAVL